MRLDRDHYMMALAKVAAEQTTCCKRGVGCVLADKHGYILAIAYNGVARGMPHCNEEGVVGGFRTLNNACKGWDLPAGQDSCEAVHAEQNALLQCHSPWEIDTCYVTLSPCKPCLKLLINTSCQRIVFAQEWEDPWSKEQWLKLGRSWELLSS